MTLCSGIMWERPPTTSNLWRLWLHPVLSFWMFVPQLVSFITLLMVFCFCPKLAFLRCDVVFFQSLAVQPNSRFLCCFAGNSINVCQNIGRHVVALEDDVEIFNAKLAFYTAPPLTLITPAEVQEALFDDEPPARDVPKKNRWAKWVEFSYLSGFFIYAVSQTILSLSEIVPLSCHQHAAFICSHGMMIWLTL